jgi:arylsulfatase
MYKGNKIKPMEGRSLAPAFANKTIQREAIYWKHEGNRAVRVGKWKAVAKGKHRQENVNWELYDIEADRSELHNLAAKHPDKLKEMVELWNAYAKRANVIPWPVSKKKSHKKNRQQNKKIKINLIRKAGE